jgi:hypothetical protein
MGHGIMKPDEITTRREITTHHHRHRHRAMATMIVTMTVIALGMDAHPVTRYKAETAHPTKVQRVEGGERGMDAHRDTRYRAASVSRILDHVS